ncbi:hypothetical protein J2741_000751 [Methanolinea mesophila]|uniref:hypothetical protein n=1 Tax=Methanolinea mesophila TaxID=547055 RepID=UPI0031595FF1|nr:hypothetical protein [Methanolinea mesophila]
MLLAGSLTVTVLLYAAGFPFFFLFLMIPIIPFVSQKKKVHRCPACGFATADPAVGFCPYDGTPLSPGADD